jgi:hypothetical protein
MVDKSAAHFTVVSAETNPDEICNRLRIKCDSAVLKGSHNPSGNPATHPLHIAIFRSRLADSVSMEDHVRDILSRIEPVRKAIKRLPKGCILAIHCNYRMRQKGGWTFTPPTLKLLAALAVPCVFSLDTETAPKSEGKKKPLQRRPKL